MKKGIHPNYRQVVFQDMTSGFTLRTGSCAQTEDTIEVEGETYPLMKMEVTADTHPFYTGKKGMMSSAGRVDRFNKRWQKKKK